MIKTFRDPIYGVNITFICKEKRSNAIKFFKKMGRDISELWDTAGGFWVKKDAFNYYLAIVINNRWQAILAHEAMHIVSRVLRERGLKLTSSSEEAFCYYVGFIVGQCSTLYRKASAKK